MRKTYIAPAVKMLVASTEATIAVSDGYRFSTWGKRENDWINEGFEGQSTANKWGVQIENNDGTIDSRSASFNVWDD